jgi:tetratricopeptide (TPR) repeat protein
MKKVLIVLIAIISVSNVYSQTAETYYNKGNSKNELQDHRGAIADYSKSIELNPNDASAYYNRGLSKYSLKMKDSGCLDLSKAGELGYENAYEKIRKLCN